MSGEESLIGKSIICSDFGVGKIVEITTLHEGGEEFYKVIFPDFQGINYFSTKNNQSYRLLSEKNVIEKAIEIFKTKFDKREYSSTQERINLQKSSLKESDVCKLAQTLSILSREKNLHAQVSKPFKKSLISFINEIEFVMGVESSQAHSMLEINKPVKKEGQ